MFPLAHPFRNSFHIIQYLILQAATTTAAVKLLMPANRDLLTLLMLMHTKNTGLQPFTGSIIYYFHQKNTIVIKKTSRFNSGS